MFFRRAFSSTRTVLQRSQEELDAYKRKRQAEWKRKQGGQSFLDHLIVTVRGGKGGDGCAAFHREKFKPFGPPSGGNGGYGGSVYFLPTPERTTLSTIPSRIRGHNGEHGKGEWQNGKAGEPLVIKVPLGTVVKEVGKDDPRRAKDEWESEEESMEADKLSTSERVERMRAKRWVHYPGYWDSNIQRDDFQDAEKAMYKVERERRLARRRRLIQNPIFLDFDKYENPNSSSSTEADNAPLGIRQPKYLGHLIAQGGQGGLGNPHFTISSNRTPRFATRGQEGERTTLFLELKLLADIGLVGMPNAGKSTLLRALTGGRAKTEVAGYAFTTLNPVVGVVRVADNGTFEGELVSNGAIYDETKTEEQAFEERLKRGEFADAYTRNQLPGSASSSPANDPHATPTPARPGHHFDLYESFRFTIADNPGLIENSASPSAHAGLGHSFLRAIERSPVLVCVVDLSAGLQVASETEIETGTENSKTMSAPAEETIEIETSSATEDAASLPEEMKTDTPSGTLNPFDPRSAVKILKTELETYQKGMSSRIRMVIANKADLIATHHPSSSSLSPTTTSASASASPSAFDVEQAKIRLRQLEECVKEEFGDGVAVVPVSAKYNMNVRKVVAFMKRYVEESRV